MIFFVLSVFSLLPFLSIYLSVGITDNFNPVEFITCFTGPVIFNVLMFIVSVRMIEKKLKEEKQWVDQLDFKLICYPDLFVYRAYPSFKVSIEFHKSKPNRQYFMDLFGTLPLDLKHEKKRKTIPIDESLESILSGHRLKSTESSWDDQQVYSFEVYNPSASKFNRHRRWARGWIHKACNTQFNALHGKHPIKSISFVNGNSEFDFDWWIPRKKRWWLGV
jgi:hypothetical protein